MEQIQGDEPDIIQLSELGDRISVTAHQRSLVLDTPGIVTLGHLPHEETGDIDISIVLANQVDQFACFGIVQLPRDLASNARTIFQTLTTTLTREGKLEPKGDIGISTGDAAVLNVMHLRDATSDDPASICIAAKEREMHTLQNIEPDVFQYSIHSVDEVVLTVGGLVATIANVLHDASKHHTSAKLNITLPGIGHNWNSEASSSAMVASEVLEEHSTFPSFEHFGGLDAEIKQITEAAIDMSSSNLLEKYGLERKHGILLQGPSGVGKTELVRALAREMRAGYQEVSVGDIMNLWVGQSEKHLRKVFTESNRSNKLTILFFDEFDGLFSKDAGGNSGAARSLIAEFKTLLSNGDKYPNVLVVAATNSLDNFDPALLRPGRFDTVIKIGEPNEAARSQIFTKYLYAQAIHYDIFSADHFPDNPIDVTVLARHTEGFNSAEIKHVLTDLLWQKMRIERDTNTEPPRITQADIVREIKAFRKSRPSDI